MLELRTLGRLDLRDPVKRGSLSAVVAQPKRVGVLCYLAVATPHGFHRRDTLLGIFWPDATQERARHALNQALYVLRQTLGDDVIETDGEDAIGVSSRGIWCDARAFDAAIDAGDRAGALELYAGELLPGFHVSESVGFERWRDDERRRRHMRAVAAASELAEEEEHTGNAAAATHWLRRAMTIDPSDEVLLRRLITALARAGDRAGAIREYDMFSRRLEQEFELAPSADTLGLIDDIRTERISVAARPVEAAQVPQIAPIPDASARGKEGKRQLRTRYRQQPLVVGAIAVVLGALMIASGAKVFAPRMRANDGSRRVFVAEFENQTGDPRFAPLGRMASDWITQELARTALVEVVPASTALRFGISRALRTSAESLGLNRVLARETGAVIVVAGAYYLHGDSLAFHAQITDGSDGTLLRSTEPVIGSAKAPLAVIERLRQRVTGALATVVDTRLRTWANKASPPPTYEAYRLYAEALEVYLQRRGYVRAAELFRQAASADSTFTAPLLWAIRAYHDASQPVRADSLIRRLEAKRQSLAPWDRAMLEYYAGLVRGDLDRAYRAMRTVVEMSPKSEWTLELAAMATYVRRPREAADLLTTLDPETGWLKDVKWRYWNILDRAQHHLGNYADELDNVRRMRKQNPEIGTASELRALAALGRHDEVVEKTTNFIATHQPTWGNRALAYGAALELRAHGADEAASKVLERALAWYATAPVKEQNGEIFRLDMAAALVAAKRLNEANALFRELSTQHPENFVYQGQLGVLAARMADSSAAQHWLTMLEQRGRPYDYGEPTVWAAAIAANLGDNDRALSLYQRALGEGFFETIDVHYRPELESLHRHGPFLELRRPKG